MLTPVSANVPRTTVGGTALREECHYRSRAEGNPTKRTHALDRLLARRQFARMAGSAGVCGRRLVSSGARGGRWVPPRRPRMASLHGSVVMPDLRAAERLVRANGWRLGVAGRACALRCHPLCETARRICCSRPERAKAERSSSPTGSARHVLVEGPGAATVVQARVRKCLLTGADCCR